MNDNILVYKIFSQIDNFEELMTVCRSFKWLIDNGFLEKQTIIYTESTRACKRLIRFEDDGC